MTDWTHLIIELADQFYDPGKRSWIVNKSNNFCSRHRLDFAISDPERCVVPFDVLGSVVGIPHSTSLA